MKVKQKAESSAVDTHIGANTILEGSISTDQSVHVEGGVKGKISAKGEVIVGSSGKAEAEINADIVVVGGQVLGDVIAHRRLEISATGQMTGNIEATEVVIDEGGKVNGLCKMRQGSET